jgi:hypothetical protein
MPTFLSSVGAMLMLVLGLLWSIYVVAWMVGVQSRLRDTAAYLKSIDWNLSKIAHSLSTLRRMDDNLPDRLPVSTSSGPATSTASCPACRAPLLSLPTPELASL